MDKRILQIGIEVNGKLNVYSDARMTVKINKSSDSKQNTCEVTISNLLKETIDYLITETSPWNPSRSPKILTVMAGRESVGVERIYVGEVISAVPSLPPDITLTMKAQTLESAKYKWSSINSPKVIQLSELSSRISKAFGLNLKMEAKDKTISNYLFNGPLAKQVKKLELVGDIDAYVDDEYLVVKDLGKALKGVVRVVSANNGMIGIPTLDEKGVRVRVLYDPNFTMGQQIEIQSDLNQAASGQFVTYNMAYSLANQDQDWYIDLSCNNDNIKSIAEKRGAIKKKDGKSK